MAPVCAPSMWIACADSRRRIRPDLHKRAALKPDQRRIPPPIRRKASSTHRQISYPAQIQDVAPELDRRSKYSIDNPQAKLPNAANSKGILSQPSGTRQTNGAGTCNAKRSPKMSIVYPALFIVAAFLAIVTIWKSIASAMPAIQRMRTQLTDTTLDYSIEVTTIYTRTAETETQARSVKTRRGSRPEPITHRLHHFPNCAHAA